MFLRKWVSLVKSRTWLWLIILVTILLEMFMSSTLMKIMPKLPRARSMVDFSEARRLTQYFPLWQISQMPSANSTLMAAASVGDIATTCMWSLYQNLSSANYSLRCTWNIHNTNKRRENKAARTISDDTSDETKTVGERGIAETETMTEIGETGEIEGRDPRTEVEKMIAKGIEETGQSPEIPPLKGSLWFNSGTRIIIRLIDFLDFYFYFF